MYHVSYFSSFEFLLNFTLIIIIHGSGRHNVIFSGANSDCLLWLFKVSPSCFLQVKTQTPFPTILSQTMNPHALSHDLLPHSSSSDC